MRIDAVSHFYPRIKKMKAIAERMKVVHYQDKLIVDESIAGGKAPLALVKGWSNPHNEDSYHLAGLETAIAKTLEAMEADLGDHYHGEGIAL